jgi:hypothetical protein
LAATFYIGAVVKPLVLIPGFPTNPNQSAFHNHSMFQMGKKNIKKRTMLFDVTKGRLSSSLFTLW